VETNRKSAMAVLKRWQIKGLAIGIIAVLSFAAGSVMTARSMQLNPGSADTNKVFELLIYHALPGKGLALESLFRDVAKMQAQYNLNVVGYWVPQNNPAWNDTLVYLISHPNLDQAKKNWRALHADPAFKPYVESGKTLINKVNDVYQVDEVYMRPTDYSAMK
jgi:hypothetical protein